MTYRIAVARYPEGAGHATRMLAVANALRDSGTEVSMAGGGAGSTFVALNGYDEFEPTPVEYIDAYQNGSLREVVTRCVPTSVARVTDYVEWFRTERPDCVVTDDMFAAVAASRVDLPLYVLKHDAPQLYTDFFERLGAKFHTSIQLSVAREFFVPAVWPPADIDIDGATRVPPVALDGTVDDVESVDVLVVPSHFSNFDRVAAHLDRQGYDVVNVGDEDWQPVASLLPYVRRADVVVCSGYSTVMDAAVAGTPCVVHPATDEQRAVARWLDRLDVTGFVFAETPLDVLDAVAGERTAPCHANGADEVAERVVADLDTVA